MVWVIVIALYEVSVFTSSTRLSNDATLNAEFPVEPIHIRLAQRQCFADANACSTGLSLTAIPWGKAAPRGQDNELRRYYAHPLVHESKWSFELF